jgi:hypothetical protein
MAPWRIDCPRPSWRGYSPAENDGAERDCHPGDAQNDGPSDEMPCDRDTAALGNVATGPVVLLFDYTDRFFSQTKHFPYWCRGKRRGMLSPTGVVVRPQNVGGTL